MGRKPKGGRRKNMRINQKLLTKAMVALGAKTETEAVEKALDEVVFRHEVLEGVRAVGGKYPDWGDPFGEDEGKPRQD